MSNTLLVIGIHREELAFGEYVAGLVAGQGVDVLRIPQGLSGQKPSPDDAFYYRLRHRELYLQLMRHVQRGHRLLIDLHTGLNESGRCADIFCQNTHLLDCLGNLLRERAHACPPGREPIRLVRIITDQEAGTEAVSADAYAYAGEPDDHPGRCLGQRTLGIRRAGGVLSAPGGRRLAGLAICC